MLSTHILDTAFGKPAAGVEISLYRLDGTGAREHLKTAATNDDGRCEGPLASAEELTAGQYEIDFHIGAYFARTATPSFLDVVTVRFIALAGQRYHVPLLVSPYGYSTYRGS